LRCCAGENFAPIKAESFEQQRAIAPVLALAALRDFVSTSSLAAPDFVKRLTPISLQNIEKSHVISVLCTQRMFKHLCASLLINPAIRLLACKCSLSNTGLKTAFRTVQNASSSLPAGTSELM
jgi:hypothetical protein